MRKAAILAVAIGMLAFTIASTAGSAGAQAPAKDPKHVLTFSRALDYAFKVARQECERNATGLVPGCLGYQAGPGSVSVFKHKVTVPIHIISGDPAADPTTWTDCHRNVQIVIKKIFGKKRFFRFVSPYTCGPNQEHFRSTLRGLH
jgi:hypothetical protein